MTTPPYTWIGPICRVPFAAWPTKATKKLYEFCDVHGGRVFREGGETELTGQPLVVVVSSSSSSSR